MVCAQRPSAATRCAVLALVAVVVAGTALVAAAGWRRMGSPAVSTGRTTTIGTASQPQVVRVGDTLREINPADPRRYLRGDFAFAGMDAYELNTSFGVNAGCGAQETTAQIDALFSSLGTDAVVRVWFFQQLAIDATTREWDWAAMDRVVQSAQAHGVRLIATLGNQDGTCDDGVWKSPTWYASGWRAPPNEGSDEIVSYQTWVDTVVNRYASSPAILAWEPVNEPRPDTCAQEGITPGWGCWSRLSCPDERAAHNSLVSFFDRVGAEISAVDPNHLISDGGPAANGCGLISEAQWDQVESSPGIDLVSLHDYSGSTPLSAAALRWYTDELRTLHKPVFVGENGDDAASTDVSTCADATARAQAYQAKVRAERAEGLVGWLYWFWSPADPPITVGPCGPGQDPFMAMIARLDTPASDSRTVTGER